MKGKSSGGRQRRRMTELDIRMIVEEIDAWRNGERGSGKLTWVKLERIFPFTRQTMYSKESIREAYENTQTSLKIGDKVRPNKADQLTYIETERLKRRIRELETQVGEWQKLWITLKV